jgi:hypothetical protein
MKQLSSFMALSVSGGDRISYTYDEIDESTGDLVSTNNKESFFVVDDGLRGHLNAIRDHIRQNRLAD